MHLINIAQTVAALAGLVLLMGGLFTLKARLRASFRSR